MSRPRRTDRGSISVLVAVLAPALFLLAGLVVDGGTAIAARQRAANVAEEAARIAANQVSIDSLRRDQPPQLITAEAVAAAQQYLAQSDATGTVRVGTQEVEVTATVTTSTILLGLIQIDDFTVTGNATARVIKDIE
jgi:Flp pilus assembly protein TadG